MSLRKPLSPTSRDRRLSWRLAHPQVFREDAPWKPPGLLPHWNEWSKWTRCQGCRHTLQIHRTYAPDGCLALYCSCSRFKPPGGNLGPR